MPKEIGQKRLSVDIDTNDFLQCWEEFPYGVQAAFMRTLTVMLGAIINTQGFGIAYLLGWMRGEHDLVLPAPNRDQRR